MKLKVIGIALAVLGLAVVALSIYQATSQVRIIAWYDMNGDNIINYRDFDLDNNGIVDSIDVQMVINAANATYQSRYDFNRDGTVDSVDVQIISAWLGKGRLALYDLNDDGKVDWHDLDVNDDGVVDVVDIATVAAAYGANVGSEKYNSRLDFNQDGVIDDADLDLIASYYGYPRLSIYDVLSPFQPVGQLFLVGVTMFVLGVMLVFARVEK